MAGTSLWRRTAMATAILLAIVICVETVHSAEPSRRVALVVGNGAYKHTSELKNPRNDATDMASVLKQLGFEVIEGQDLDKTTFDRKIREFATILSGADAGLFFYAGHGFQVSGVNYLVPIDAQPPKAASLLDYDMVRLDSIQRIMEDQAKTNILFLDACRDNPLIRSLSRSLGPRSAAIGRGLAAAEAEAGTLISYSTAPGTTAEDGEGRNSPFTGPLVRMLANSAEDLQAVLMEVRNQVMNTTDNKQVPWEHSALRARFYFKAPNATLAPAVTAPAQPPLSEAAQTWEQIKDKTSIAAFEMFLKRFEGSAEAILALARVEELKKARAPDAPPLPLAQAPSPAAPPSQLATAPPLTQFPGTTEPLPQSSGNCKLDAKQVSADEAGRVTFALTSSCPMEMVRIRYRDWSFERRPASNAKPYQLVFDLFQGAAPLTFDTGGGAITTVMPTVPSTLSVMKLALIWDAKVDLNMHVLQFAAEPGEINDVWIGNPRQLMEARGGQTGFLSYFEPGQRLQVYTFITSSTSRRGTLQLRVDYVSRGARTAAPFCGSDPLARVEYKVVQFESGSPEQRSPRPRSSSIAAKPCGATLSDKERYESPISMIKLL